MIDDKTLSKQIMCEIKNSLLNSFSLKSENVKISNVIFEYETLDSEMKLEILYPSSLFFLRLNSLKIRGSTLDMVKTYYL